ncbi:MAG: MarR family winged helix-turn-helix transcriptional regulator, partial [Flavobacterium sp.]
DKNFDYILKNTWQAVSRMYNEEASNYGASIAIGFALLNIDKEKGCTATALANGLGLEPTSITRLLNSMIDKNLIIKKKNPEDGRGVLIFLTEFGLEKRELSKKTVIKFNETIRKNITDEDFIGFFNVTNTINQLIENKLIY